MKKKLTKEEQLIKFLNKEYENSDTNEVSVYKNDVLCLNISEQEASRTIHLLQEGDPLRIRQKSPQNDFSMPWTVALMPSCIHYFDNKKLNKRTKIKNFFKESRAWITLIIAILSFILAI